MPKIAPSRRKIPFRYCFVPKCVNTTSKTPLKVFIPVPKNATVRKQWCDAAGFQGAEHLQASAHICEDHFNVYLLISILINDEVKK